MQVTLGRPLRRGSERPFAPSPNHFRAASYFRPLSQALWFAKEVLEEGHLRSHVAREKRPNLAAVLGCDQTLSAQLLCLYIGALRAELTQALTNGIWTQPLRAKIDTELAPECIFCDQHVRETQVCFECPRLERLRTWAPEYQNEWQNCSVASKRCLYIDVGAMRSLKKACPAIQVAARAHFKGPTSSVK